MLYREIVDVCSQIHTKHINALCGQNVEFLDIKVGGIYSGHWVLENQLTNVCLAFMGLPDNVVTYFSISPYSVRCANHVFHTNNVCHNRIAFCIFVITPPEAQCYHLCNSRD
jgi:hypothetical protein